MGWYLLLLTSSTQLTQHKPGVLRRGKLAARKLFGNWPRYQLQCPHARARVRERRNNISSRGDIELSISNPTVHDNWKLSPPEQKTQTVQLAHNYFHQYINTPNLNLPCMPCSNYSPTPFYHAPRKISKSHFNNDRLLHSALLFFNQLPYSWSTHPGLRFARTL